MSAQSKVAHINTQELVEAMPAMQNAKAELEKFILDKSNNPRARRLAYETLIKVDAGASERIIPGMINDPSVTLRRDAVQRLIDEAKKLEKDGKKDAAKQAYEQALSGATDDDQVKAIVKPLRSLVQEAQAVRAALVQLPIALVVLAVPEVQAHPQMLLQNCCYLHMSPLRSVAAPQALQQAGHVRPYAAWLIDCSF